MMNMTQTMIGRSIMQDKLSYKGRALIISTVELFDCFETIAMRTDGTEVECSHSECEDAAILEHKRMRNKYAAPAPLSGKYAKLRDDIKTALAIGRAAEDANPEDGGTCNFDSPALYLPRWNGRLVAQAAKEAGSGAFEWKGYGGRRYVLRPDSFAQANARSRNAEAAAKALSALGYDCMMYYQMD
jgi:hypothetical protein